MKNEFHKQKKNIKNGIFLLLITIFGLISIIASTPPIKESILGIASALASSYRSGGGAFLTLDSDIKQNVSIVSAFDSEPYPPNVNTDETFYTSSRINSLMGGDATLNKYRLLCGVDTTVGETERITYVVFWSENFWAGQKQKVNCGPSNTPIYEASGTIWNAANSFCVVTDKTPSGRRLRCTNGPRCDDGMKNGSESDTDCGGSCINKCSVNKSCDYNKSNCSGNVLCTNNICQPPRCNDGLKNGTETDVDCGGNCGQCQVNQACYHNWECISDQCWPRGPNNQKICVAKPNSKTCSNATATPAAKLWGVLVENIVGCGGVKSYYANDQTEAEDCAQSAGLSTISTLCEYKVQIETSAFDPTKPTWVSPVEASSESNALNCAKATICSNCPLKILETGPCVTLP